MNRIPDWMNTHYIAHRGYFDRDSPENSIGAFQKAIDAGFAIELDVQILKDGTLIVFHDSKLKRLTGVKGNVSDYIYDDIKKMKLLNTQESIPTFEQVLSLVNGQVPLMVELKNEGRSQRLERSTYDLLKLYKGQYIMQSFNPLSLLWYKKNAKEVVRGQLSSRHENSKLNGLAKFVMRNMFSNLITKPDFVIYDIHALHYGIIKWLKFIRKPLYGYTAKSKAEFLKSKAQGVNAVFEQFDPRNL